MQYTIILLLLGLVVYAVYLYWIWIFVFISAFFLYHFLDDSERGIVNERIKAFFEWMEKLVTKLNQLFQSLTFAKRLSIITLISCGLVGMIVYHIYETYSNLPQIIQCSDWQKKMEAQKNRLFTQALQKEKIHKSNCNQVCQSGLYSEVAKLCDKTPDKTLLSVTTEVVLAYREPLDVNSTCAKYEYKDYEKQRHFAKKLTAGWFEDNKKDMPSDDFRIYLSCDEENASVKVSNLITKNIERKLSEKPAPISRGTAVNRSCVSLCRNSSESYYRCISNCKSDMDDALKAFYGY